MTLPGRTGMRAGSSGFASGFGERGFGERGLRRAAFDDFGRFGGYGWPYLWDYPFFGDYWDAYGMEPTPTIVMVQPPAPPEPPPPPPPPPVPAIHEYTWSDAGSDSNAAFSIALKNGTTESAVAVWTQGDRVCFITSNGVERQVPVSQIDRANTMQMNHAKRLKLSIPIGEEGS